MIIELDLNGARVIISGDNLAVSVSEGPTQAEQSPQKEAKRTGMRHIRKNVFRMNQVEFAEIAGVHQTSVSRWENGVPPSLNEMKAIRNAAKNLGFVLDDALFFEAAI